MAKKLDWLMIILMEFLKIIFLNNNKSNLDIFHVN